MKLYRTMRMKMIIAWESWSRHIKPSDLFQQAVLRTIIDKIKLKVAAIQKCLPEGMTVLTLSKQIKQRKLGGQFDEDDLSEKCGAMLDEMISLKEIMRVIVEKLCDDGNSWGCVKVLCGKTNEDLMEK